MPVDVGANDSAYGEDYRIKTQGTIGTAYVTGWGELVYESDGTVGQDTVEYEVKDSNGQWFAASVSVTVTNTAPVGVADLAMAEFATATNISPDDLLLNDTDVDPLDTAQYGGLTIAAVQNGSNGTVNLSPQGVLTFTPTDGFVGDATFQYKVKDTKNAQSQWTTVTVTVGASPLKYGNNTAAGRPGAAVGRNGAGEAVLDFWGYGPLNKQIAVRVEAVYWDAGLQSYVSTGHFDFFTTTSSSNGYWAKSILWNVPAGSTIEYSLWENINPPGQNPLYQQVSGTTHSTYAP